MKRTSFLLITIVLLAITPLLAQAPAPPAQPQAPAPAAQPAPPQTLTSVLDRRWSGVEKQFVDLADAMPDDKFSFKPTNGLFTDVRTFGEQARHVAAANYSYAAAMLGEKPPVETAGESGPDTIKTKPDIMKYLRDSFAYMHRAMQAMNAENAVAPITPSPGRTSTRLWLATQAIYHCGDHYGQLVVYLRMNGIVPPASRRQ
jgi:uncharacterized damage-inducible protein DinB